MYLSYTFPRMIYTSYVNNEALGCFLCCSWRKMKKQCYLWFRADLYMYMFV